MKMLKFMFLIVMVLGMSGSVSAAVLLDETFDGTEIDTETWNILDTQTEPASTVVALDGSGNLDITLSYSPRWYNQGLGSKVGYALPAGEMLIFDWYGTNLPEHTYPMTALSAYESTEEQGFFGGYLGNWAGWKGADAYYGDWAQHTGIGYADLAGDNITTPQHIIMTVTDSFIRYHIATDYYENLTNPATLYRVATASLFTDADLASGLYVHVLAARYTSWWSGVNTESYDGVKVSTGAVPEPVSLVLFGIAGATMILRKKK